jgi:putative hydrolase of the HAD superfamily
MNNKQFAAVAFDLDGTLYPNYRFYIRLVPFIIKEQRLMRAFGKARDRLREKRDGEGAFYERQARFMSEILGEPADKVQKKVELLIYRGWEPIFNKVKLYPQVKETLEALRAGGMKLGLLSDFPLEEKLKNLDISGYWDTVLCSEAVGQLKPDPLPFEELARRMNFPPEKILYVGNSFSYDVVGAKRAGMGAAWISSSRRESPRAGSVFPGIKADFVFSGYRQLRDYVLT